jgi:integrase/recombinase XerC
MEEGVYKVAKVEKNTTREIVPHDAPVDLQKLVDAFLFRRSLTTRKTYRFNLRHFAAYLGLPTAEEGVRRLLAMGHAQANLAVLEYQSAMIGNLSPATINNRIAAIRSMVRLARTLDMVSWTLDIESLRTAAYRDTAGPGIHGFVRILRQAESAGGLKGARDAAIVRLLFDLGLRRIEACRLDVEDIDLDGARIMVMGKGRMEKAPLTLPAPTVAVLREWLRRRGTVPGGPCFVAFAKSAIASGKPVRLNPEAVSAMVSGHAAAAGIRATPHGLRHAAITAALDITGGNIRSAAKFSRHAQINTVQRYDDNRQDLAGDVARMVAAAAGSVQEQTNGRGN